MAWYWIVAIVLGALWILTMVVYWFNLDNKMIFNLVRPMLSKNYDKQKRDVSI